MDSSTNTDSGTDEVKTVQENLLLDFIKELCSESNSPLSTKVKDKVNSILTACELTCYTSLHKLSSAHEQTSTVLGLIKDTPSELTFEEQTELNQAVIDKIETKLPPYITQLENIEINSTQNEPTEDQIKELQRSLDEKINILHEQEIEKVNLMKEWLNYRFTEISKFTDDSSELLELKTKILDLKSKILHQQILQNIFTETGDSVKAYNQIYKDIKDSIEETEQQAKKLKAIEEHLKHCKCNE